MQIHNFHHRIESTIHVFLQHCIPTNNYSMRLSLPLLLAMIFIASATDAQPISEAVNDSIVREGSMLYRSERASWIATDGMMQLFSGRADSIGGYLSYDDGPRVTSIFFT